MHHKRVIELLQACSSWQRIVQAPHLNCLNFGGKIFLRTVPVATQSLQTDAGLTLVRVTNIDGSVRLSLFWGEGLTYARVHRTRGRVCAACWQ